jgi:hypothetical protein
MKKSFAILFALNMLCFSIDSYAQLPSIRNIRKRVIVRAADRTVDKAGHKIDEGVDKSVDKVFDSLFGNPSKSENAEAPTTNNISNTNSSQSQADAMKMINGMLGGMGNAEAPYETYTFYSSYMMNIKSNTKDGPFAMKTKYYFTDKGNHIGTKILASSDKKMNGNIQTMEAIIMDFDKSSMYTFINSN